MININATRNNNPLRLKGGEKNGSGFCRSAKKMAGFGLYHGKKIRDPTRSIGCLPPIRGPRQKLVDERRKILYRWYDWEMAQQIDFNKLGQRIKATERWEVDKGTHYDTLIMDKTINTNKIILKANSAPDGSLLIRSWTPLHRWWIFRKTTGDIAANVVMIFNKRKAMINGVSDGMAIWCFTECRQEKA